MVMTPVRAAWNANAWKSETIIDIGQAMVLSGSSSATSSDTNVERTDSPAPWLTIAISIGEGPGAAAVVGNVIGVGR